MNADFELLPPVVERSLDDSGIARADAVSNAFLDGLARQRRGDDRRESMGRVRVRVPVDVFEEGIELLVG